MKAMFKNVMKEKNQHKHLLDRLKKHFREDEDEMEQEDEKEESEDEGDDEEEDDEMEDESPLKAMAKLVSKRRYKPENEEYDDIESQIQPGFPATEQEFEGVDDEKKAHMRLPKEKRKEMAIIIMSKKLGKKHGKKED